MQSLNPRRLGAKIINLATSSKTYWSILESFATCRKIPVVPTLFINDVLFLIFKLTPIIFNKFLSQQCIEISIDNSISLAVNVFTNQTLTTTNFD